MPCLTQPSASTTWCETSSDKENLASRSTRNRPLPGPGFLPALRFCGSVRGWGSRGRGSGSREIRMKQSSQRDKPHLGGLHSPGDASALKLSGKLLANNTLASLLSAYARSSCRQPTTGRSRRVKSRRPLRWAAEEPPPHGWALVLNRGSSRCQPGRADVVHTQQQVKGSRVRPQELIPGVGAGCEQLLQRDPWRPQHPQ